MCDQNSQPKPRGLGYGVGIARSPVAAIQSQPFIPLHSVTPHNDEDSWVEHFGADRETELAEEFPIHVVTKWLGNSPKVATRHYLLATEEHFARALDGSISAAQNPAQLASKAAQNPAQQGACKKHARKRKNPGEHW